MSLVRPIIRHVRLAFRLLPINSHLNADRNANQANTATIPGHLIRLHRSLVLVLTRTESLGTKGGQKSLVTVRERLHRITLVTYLATCQGLKGPDLTRVARTVAFHLVSRARLVGLQVVHPHPLMALNSHSQFLSTGPSNVARRTGWRWCVCASRVLCSVFVGLGGSVV